VADDVQLPPQATGNTLPGQAADLGDIAPAPTAEDALLAANFGDEGAQQYRDLRAAGQKVPTTTAAPAQPAPAPAPAGGGDLSALATGAANVTGDVLTGLATGDPTAGMQMRLKRQQLQQALQEQAQKIALDDATFVEHLQNEPLDVRRDMIVARAVKMGRPISQAEANYIAQIDPEHLEHTRLMAEQGDVTALASLKALFGGNPIDMVTAKGDIVKRSADSAKAVSEATITGAKVPYAGRLAEAEARQKEAEAARAEASASSTPIRLSTAEADRLAKTDPKYALGSPDRTNFIGRRTAEFEANIALRKKAALPLAGAEATDFRKAQMAGAFAAAALATLNDPDVANNRGLWEGRLKSFYYLLGKDQNPNEDLYQTLNNLSGIMSSTQYSGGVRNMQYLNRVFEHTSKPGDELNLVREKLNVILGAAHEQQEGIINIHKTGGMQLKPTVAAPKMKGVPGSAAETYTNPDELKAAVTGGKVSRAEGEQIARQNGWIR
jgi:hypothetical protein